MNQEVKGLRERLAEVESLLRATMEERYLLRERVQQLEVALTAAKSDCAHLKRALKQAQRQKSPTKRAKT